MKKLDINIEEIIIDGRPEELTNIVQEIDLRMQNLSQSTEVVKYLLFKYGNTNLGIQYSNACNNVSILSENLFNSSEVLNDLQFQIVAFENKVLNYEEQRNFASNPQRHNVQKINIDINTSKIHFYKNEILDVIKGIETYFSFARDENKTLKNNRDEIGLIWKDVQFRDFSLVIDEVSLYIEQGCKGLEEYKMFLEEKVKGLE